MQELKTRAFREVSLLLTSESFIRGMPDLQSATTNTYLCGECDTILVDDRSSRSVEDGIVRCSNCGAINDLTAWLPWLGHAMLKLCPGCNRYRRHPGQPLCGSCWCS